MISPTSSNPLSGAVPRALPTPTGPGNAAPAEGNRAAGDRVTLGREGLRALAAESETSGEEAPPGELTPEEEKRVAELRARDREVRAHEQAHKAAAGDLAVGGPTYETETGPDGREYAVAGEVQIRLREGDTPEETVRLAERARRAALAPAEPSSQDRAVAAEASQMAASARAEMRTEEAEGPGEAAGGPPDPRLEARAGAYAEVGLSPIEPATDLLA